MIARGKGRVRLWTWAHLAPENEGFQVRRQRCADLLLGLRRLLERGEG